ncbi:hypothetical protein BgAZ_302030 [Babesia gibsoni]|uniref:Uncharacterized protein n=1 Tax=Babesia gibsoni TaxID=33632 RepID=A0AAD8LHC9_BABGI|nr:hypothetical protein BgAZ_302030 [Babesia gibsoni]
MRYNAKSSSHGGDSTSEGFKIECYGPDDERVLRYFNGSIIREAKINNYFTTKEKASSSEVESLQDLLERGNNDNWYIAASTICMASSIWAQKSNPVEWEEARVFQQNANAIFSKAHMLLEGIKVSRKLQLNHTVTPNETNTQLVKYAIHSRNKRLQECAKKTKELAERISISLKLQLNFLKMVSEIKSQFKVLINARNLVDVSTFDVDYPASFSVFAIFYDIAFRTNDTSDIKVWEAWELHKKSPPTATQQCLISYYEQTDSEDGLTTRMTFPLAVSHFIQNGFSITVNEAHVPMYDESENSKVCYRLKQAQICLLDRLIYTTLCQSALDYLRKPKPILIGDSTLYVKSMTSEKLVIIHKSLSITVAYTAMGSQESGDTMWKLAVMKLRDMAIQNWKNQVYLHKVGTFNMLEEFLSYIIKLSSNL